MIKNIYCFGTSYTAGGGFEFEGFGPKRNERIHKAYKSIKEEKKQFWFSYPGRLQRLLPNMNVINHAKQGYGNERLYRKTYEVINSFGFNPHENLFIFEFSWMGRKEFWLNEINDYIIANYGFNEDNKVNDCALAQSYHYDSFEMGKVVDNYHDMFLDFFKATYDSDNQRDLIERNISMFFSYLKDNQVKFIVTAQPVISTEKDMKYLHENNLMIRYRAQENNRNHTYFLEDVISHNPWKIDDETDGVWNDFHGGFYFNELVAHLIRNKMIDLKMIDGDIISEDELYSKFRQKFNEHKYTIEDTKLL